jgi:serine/threonine-protein kinase RsbW
MASGEGVMERLGSPLAHDQDDADLQPQVRLFFGQERQLREMRQWLAILLSAHPAVDDIISIATELATNAIRHTKSGVPGGSFAVVITGRPGAIRVAVADHGGLREPQVIDDPDGENGRGLLIVLRLAARVGVRGDHWGRLVWADVRCQAAPGADLGLSDDDRLLGGVDAEELPQMGEGERALRQLRDDGII